MITAFERLARALALAGGAVLLAAACLTVVSGTSRWLTSQPVRGDFEIISIASGLAVLGFLAWCTQRRGNILVDSFTTWLPARLNGVIDAFWSLVWAATTLLIAERNKQLRYIFPLGWNFNNRLHNYIISYLVMFVKPLFIFKVNSTTYK